MDPRVPHCRVPRNARRHRGGRDCAAGGLALLRPCQCNLLHLRDAKKGVNSRGCASGSMGGQIEALVFKAGNFGHNFGIQLGLEFLENILDLNLKPGRGTTRT